MSRVKDEIIKVEKYLHELREIVPDSFSNYSENFEKKAACERYFEKIVESVVSISYLFCRHENFEIQDKSRSFDILLENKIISKELLVKLKEAKGMKNIIAHKYGEIDDFIVFETIIKELIQDIEFFISNLSKLL